MEARSRFSIAARRTTIAGGAILRAFAHASRSAAVWQQHDRQHDAASAHPHVDPWQGKDAWPFTAGRE
jgi:hypothetical protein